MLLKCIILSIVAPRVDNSSITPPIYSSLTSICSSSYGSHFMPSISLIITLGLETSSSKPSRRIFSINIDKCNSPLPETIKFSESICSTFKLTSFWVSLNNLSPIFLDVKSFPSLPLKGEELTPKVICNVGSSTWITGSRSWPFISVIVSPTLISSKPAIATISPASALSISTLLSPENPNSFWILNCFSVPSRRKALTIWFTLTVPLKTFPIAILPT